MTTEPLFRMACDDCLDCNEVSDWLDIDDALHWTCEDEEHMSTEIMAHANIPHGLTAREMLDAYDELGDSDEFDRWLRYVDQVGKVEAWEFSSRFIGRYWSTTEFAESFADELYEIPDNLTAYIDYEKLGEDLMHDFYVVEDDNGYYEIYYTD